jgi:hypothetical protein
MPSSPLSRRHAATAAVALLLAACGGDPDPSEPTPPGDVDLPDPGPGGFQLETGLIPVQPGEEVQSCYFFEVPFDHAVWVNHVELAQNQGSHHMNVFRVKTVVNLDGEPGSVIEGGECWNAPNWADWPLLVNSQSSGAEDWQMPEGVALRLEPHEKIMLQSHYVNATTQVTPSSGKAVVNFHGVDEGEVRDEMGTLFATNQNIEVCPGQASVKYEATCKVATEGPVTVAAANGHFHSRGKRFTMETFDARTGEGERFYESLVWDDPPFERGLAAEIPKDGGIRWTCEFGAPPDACGDPEKACCFTFGPKVETSEHCNAFVYYYPRGPTDRNCF